MFIAVAALAFLQQVQGQQPSQATLAPSPVARIVVTPANPVVQAGDTIQLRAEAFDASGARLAPPLKFTPAGGWSHAAVDTTGLIVGATVGKVPVSVIATVPGARPFVQRVELRVVPGPATRVEISPQPARLVAGQRLLLTAEAFSAANDRREERVNWQSSAPAVLRVDNGLLTAVAPGRATITATVASSRATRSFAVQVVSNTIASVDVTPRRVTLRQGDVVGFTATARTAGGTAVEGVSPTWSFSPGHGQIDADGKFVAYQPGEYVVTASYGSRSADAVVTVEPRNVRRPVRVVGRLPRTGFLTAEVWIHPNGNVAYLGTHGGGDRVYTIDISNPANPVVVDSIQMNTRLVNDVMTTPDGKFLVMTREGAADRKNGIVIAEISDPLRPKAISEFTEGVTAGVHSAFVYKDPKHGQHIYLTNDGTGELHIINIDDPYKPREVARWAPERNPHGRYIHDIDVQDGLVYASWWDDGLIILDVGNGIKGGTPSSPKLVTQYKYDLDKLYNEVEVVSGAGFTRGTHTAWRHKNYVFIADEVYRASPVAGAKDAAANRMYGTLQVLDVSTIEKPKVVAWYTPEYGGVHNLWVRGDTLYMGAYDGGFRAFDISGELRGDLRAQGREIAHVHTADMQGFVKNAAQTWGVVVNPKDGLAYVNDFNNGLWIIRIEPKQPVTP
ncbi:MAG: Ig-like domain-containing protein [Gemmatimonadota bacterium]|nr:Ig-like domain-containing protein [Gemmatimonadota bacterium]